MVRRRPERLCVHPEAHQAEVVSLFRITPRDEWKAGGGGG